MGMADFQAWLYDTMRAILSEPEPSSGVRVGMLTYQQTKLYDVLVARVKEQDAVIRHPAVLEAIRSAEYAESCSEDGYTPRLRALREYLIALGPLERASSAPPAPAEGD